LVLKENKNKTMIQKQHIQTSTNKRVCLYFGKKVELGGVGVGTQLLLNVTYDFKGYLNFS